MSLRKLKIEPGTEKDAPQSKQRDLDRPTANEIYEQVARNGRRELQRGAFALALSGIVGGLTMGLTGLSVSVVQAQLGTAGWDGSVLRFLHLFSLNHLRQRTPRPGHLQLAFE